MSFFVIYPHTRAIGGRVLQLKTGHQRLVERAEVSMQLLTIAQVSQVRLIEHNKITYQRQTIPGYRFCLHRTSGKGSHPYTV